MPEKSKPAGAEAPGMSVQPMNSEQFYAVWIKGKRHLQFASPFVIATEFAEAYLAHAAARASVSLPQPEDLEWIKDCAKELVERNADRGRSYDNSPDYLETAAAIQRHCLLAAAAVSLPQAPALDIEHVATELLDVMHAPRGIWGESWATYSQATRKQIFVDILKAAGVSLPAAPPTEGK